ncbi:MAG: hypothetical protein A2622_02495 [Bdellovibrionales bacterium RIFCSPHIGHO2_01_FULL_40_29]|nr:MAG: hypothetical protein A2622_02495 [Bdellovibrionales bacterium RIFCSPHIGHO2_01_FULL_40_29]OFZ33951.1 MAG: hypothetical protein A3D17_02915 [Bdellovibrionales bacterium RIFCSPHIGHO2_02_FULL_40_15]
MTQSMPLIPSDDPNQIGVLKPGSVVEVMERRALAVRVKLWLISQGVELPPTSETWLFKDDSDPQTVAKFTEIPPIHEVTEAQVCTSDECLAGSPQKNSSVTEKNIKDLQDIADKTQKESTTKEPKTIQDLSLTQKIKNYSDSAQVRASIRYAKSRASRSRGLCYRSVKKALDAGVARGKEPLTPGPYINSHAARYAEKDLQDKRFGFINLLKTPPYDKEIKSAIDAPKGAVLVYSSGLKCDLRNPKTGRIIKREPDCGHVEIKTDDAGKPGFVSDFYSTTAITSVAANRLRRGAKYKLIGVMVKPMDSK